MYVRLCLSVSPCGWVAWRSPLLARLISWISKAGPSLITSALDQSTERVEEFRMRMLLCCLATMTTMVMMMMCTWSQCYFVSYDSTTMCRDRFGRNLTSMTDLLIMAGSYGLPVAVIRRRRRKKGCLHFGAEVFHPIIMSGVVYVTSRSPFRVEQPLSLSVHFHFYPCSSVSFQLHLHTHTQAHLSIVLMKLMEVNNVSTILSFFACLVESNLLSLQIWNARAFSIWLH